jgi:diguanylate cyclase (GGDEF)-like protein
VAQDDDSSLDDDEEGRETTVIISVAEIRRAQQRRERDRHLLVRMHGEHLGNVFTLNDKACRVGRHQESELWLGDGGISRRHATITPQLAGYVLEDLDSANGTFVHGQRVKQHLLRDGDVMQFGPSVVFRYSITDQDQEAMLRQLYEASVKDSLTGAYNREHLDSRLRSELSYAKRHKTGLSLVMLDIDHFKRVNDTHGHQAGDAVLIAVAQKISRSLRSEDIFARYGGEEFAIILRAIDLDGAARVGDRLRRAVDGLEIEHEGKLLRVTISVGCASLACCSDPTAEALLGVADKRLYGAKRGGRNRVVAAG